MGVHRHRGREHFLRPCRKAQRCGQGHGGGFHRRAAAVGAGEHPVPGDHGPGRAGRPEEPLHGRRAGARGGPLGRGADQRRADRVAGGCVAVLDAALRGNPLCQRPRPHHAGVPAQGKRQPGAGQRAVAVQRPHPAVPDRHPVQQFHLPQPAVPGDLHDPRALLLVRGLRAAPGLAPRDLRTGTR
ncbi:hypothetical protein D3C78_1305480 [compost metagenome]